MNRHLRNIAAFAVGVLISFLMIVPSAYSASFLLAGNGATSINGSRFVSGGSTSSARFSTSPAEYLSYTASNDNIYVTRRTPFKYTSKYGTAANGDIYDIPTIGKAGLRTTLKGIMRGGFIGLGLGLLQEYAIQKGYQWMDDAKQYYVTPPIQTPYQTKNGLTIDAFCKSLYGGGAIGYIRNGVVYCNNGSSEYGWGYPDSKLSCPSGYTLSGSSCVAPAAPAGDADISKFVDDVVANAPDRALKDLIAARIPFDYQDPQNKSLPSPVITPPAITEISTQNNPDGSKTETRKSSEIELAIDPAGNISETEKQKEVTTQKDPAGNPISETSKETKNTPETYPSISDTDMPTVPSLYTQKYPNGLKGVWEAKKAAFQNTALMQSIVSLTPSGWTAGTCPSWSMNLNIARFASYGDQPLPFPCWVVPFLKAVMLLTAAFTARKLIWG